jgi:hypothetical protein
VSNGFCTVSVIFSFTFIFFCRTAAKKGLAIYTFLVRLYQYDDDRLEETERALETAGEWSLESLHREFYKGYEDGFCTKTRENPTINIHTFSHLLESRRRNGPLWQTSAEDFESMYAVMRRCYEAGTRNTPKQILENYYLRIQ